MVFVRWSASGKIQEKVELVSVRIGSLAGARSPRIFFDRTFDGLGLIYRGRRPPRFLHGRRLALSARLQQSRLLIAGGRLRALAATILACAPFHARLCLHGDLLVD